MVVVLGGMHDISGQKSLYHPKLVPGNLKPIKHKS